jgi:adenylate cyclase
LGDEDQMHRALWNLVSNAIKFTPNGGSVSVVSETREKHVILQVKDTGTGIPQEELSSLFSEFRRLEGAVNTEGTGLGLFIVKTIVEVHGGTVTVQSTLGAGTTFTILLPRHPRKSEAALRRAA